MSSGPLGNALVSGQRPPDYALPYVVIASNTVTRTILEKVFLLVAIVFISILVTHIYILPALQVLQLFNINTNT